MRIEAVIPLGTLPPLEGMLDEHYAARGRDSNGIRKAKKLAKLGLEATLLPRP